MINSLGRGNTAMQIGVRRYYTRGRLTEPMRGVCLALTLFFASLADGCSRRSSATRAAVAVDAGERIAFPILPHLPGSEHIPGMEINVPLGWLFLPEDPVPTGSAPNVIVGAELPCGYRPLLATVEASSLALGVRVVARYAHKGAPKDADTCPQRPILVEYVSLAKVRLGALTVRDATSHAVTDPMAPSVMLRVVQDDHVSPPPEIRRMRRCTPGDDASCTAGGVCGTLPERPSRCVCVPPIDPFLFASQRCRAGTIAVGLRHQGDFAVRPAPPSGTVRACLPSCPPSGDCGPGLECVPYDGSSGICLPGSPDSHRAVLRP